jgi:hypothetical protein
LCTSSLTFTQMRTASSAPELADDDPCALPPMIQLIGPNLHHLATLGPVFSCVRVGATHVVRLLVRQLPFDGVWIPAAHFIQPYRRSGTKPMSSRLVLGVTETT